MFWRPSLPVMRSEGRVLVAIPFIAAGEFVYALQMVWHTILASETLGACEACPHVRLAAHLGSRRPRNLFLGCSNPGR